MALTGALRLRPAAPGAGAPPAGPARPRRRVLLLALLLPLLLLALVLPVLPVHLVQAVAAGPGTPADALLPADLSWRVQLVEGDSVAVRLPLSDGGVPLPEDAVDLTGPWERSADDPQVVRLLAPGASVGVDGTFRVLAGQVDLSVAGVTVRTQPPLPDATGVLPLEARSGLGVHVTTSSLWNGLQDAERGEGLAGAPAPRAWTGLLRLPVEERPDRLVVDGTTAASLVLQALLGLWPVLAGTLLLLALSTAVGRGTAALVRVPDVLRGSAALSAALGLSVLVLLVGALAYYVPVRTAVLLLALPVLLLAALGCRGLRGARPLRAPAPLAVALASTVLLLAALPLAVTRGWGLGYLQTDVVDTLRLSVLFWEQSALAAATDFGNGFRLTDYAARSALTGVLGLTPAEGFSALRLTLLLLVVLLAHDTGRQLRLGRTATTALALTAGLSSASWGLFVEGYNTREGFATTALVAVLFLLRLLPETRPAAFALVGVVAAVPVALVPPYSAFVAGLGAVALLSAGRGWRARLRPALGLAAGLAVLGLPNVVWLYDVQRASPYIPFLNELSFRLVPYQDQPELFASALGVLPFHVQRQALLGPEVGTWLPGPLRAATGALDTSPAPVIALVLVVAATVGAVVLSLRHRPRPASAATAAAVLLASVLLAGTAMRLLLWPDQRYAVLMYVWTLAPLAVLLLVLLWTTAAGPRAARLPLLAAAVGLCLVNVLSTLVDGSRWFDSPASRTSQATHLDVVPAVLALQGWAERLPEDTTYYVLSTPSALDGTDDDRVLANLADQVLQAAGAECQGCSYREENAFLDAEREPRTGTRAATTDLVVEVGGRTCGQPLLREGALSVCRAAP